jgi:hypothetical protein
LVRLEPVDDVGSDLVSVRFVQELMAGIRVERDIDVEACGFERVGEGGRVCSHRGELVGVGVDGRMSGWSAWASTVA